MHDSTTATSGRLADCTGQLLNPAGFIGQIDVLTTRHLLLTFLKSIHSVLTSINKHVRCNKRLTYNSTLQLASTASIYTRCTANISSRLRPRTSMRSSSAKLHRHIVNVSSCSTFLPVSSSQLPCRVINRKHRQKDKLFSRASSVCVMNPAQFDCGAV